MIQALQIMLMAALIAAVTSFMISLLIQVLCRLIREKTPAAAENDGALVALAIAVALDQNKKLG